MKKWAEHNMYKKEKAGLPGKNILRGQAKDGRKEVESFLQTSQTKGKKNKGKEKREAKK